MQKELLLKNLPKSIRSGVPCCDHWDKIKTITKINCGYLASTTHISMFWVFLCKIEIVEKIKWPFASGCGSHHFNVKIYEKFFYYVQANKIVKSKVLVVKGSNLTHGDHFLSIFQILMF